MSQLKEVAKKFSHAFMHFTVQCMLASVGASARATEEMQKRKEDVSSWDVSCETSVFRMMEKNNFDRY